MRNEPKIQFVLFGDGKERVNIEQEVRRRELTNVLLAGVYPKREMPFVLASSDVCLAILQNILMFRTTYPNKVFDYMAAGTGDNPGHRRGHPGGDRDIQRGSVCGAGG